MSLKASQFPPHCLSLHWLKDHNSPPHYQYFHVIESPIISFTLSCHVIQSPTIPSSPSILWCDSKPHNSLLTTCLVMWFKAPQFLPHHLSFHVIQSPTIPSSPPILSCDSKPHNSFLTTCLFVIQSPTIPSSLPVFSCDSKPHDSLLTTYLFMWFKAPQFLPHHASVHVIESFTIPLPIFAI